MAEIPIVELEADPLTERKCKASWKLPLTSFSKSELGTLRDYEAKLYVSDDACPKFCRACPVPLYMKPMVEKELHGKIGGTRHLSPVQFAEWAAPIFPVLKGDKQSVQICGDFKLTVNQVAKLNCYPIRKADDLLANLAVGVSFTKLDLSQAYQQVCLDEESKKLVVVNTHKGFFQFNRLPYGVSSAPGIFQRIKESLQHRYFSED